jgi:hypothetical protein
MVMEGPSAGANNTTVLNRVTWTPMPNGVVRQFWRRHPIKARRGRRPSTGITTSGAHNLLWCDAIRPIARDCYPRSSRAAATIAPTFAAAVSPLLIGRLKNVPKPQSGFRKIRSGA